MSKVPTSAGARWSIVIISLGVTASSFLFINGVAFLIPALKATRDASLTEAGLLSSMPSWGMVITLVGWGYVLDRVGERIVMTVGSALTALAAYAAASVDSLVLMGFFLFLGGMAAASCNSAGGRLVSGWFPPQQRGLAMGIRQTAQPLGIAVGALVIPELAERSPHAGLMFPAAACTVAALASLIGVVDPPRKSRKTATRAELANPYRESSVLWRIHVVSALLMMPQTVTVTFMLVWLMNHHGWSVAAAGVLVTISQLLGALGRIAVGRWSDHVGSRMRPVRIIAIAAALALFLLALTDNIGSRYDVLLMITISVIAVLDNGLEATAITEYAGQFWSGRALGTQNTTQRLAAAAGPPLFGALISASAYPLAWALCALFPLAAVPLVPTRLLPPGLEIKARRQSVRRHRWWQAVRSRDLPNMSRPLGPPGRRRRPRRGGQAAAPPT
ncbi:putative MFS-type transporter [Mycobacterium simulans]|uniref:Putative MFS-type transporter n=1 Tax=Mycobacterium simulans TaxID=627089 RepID=A0A7Z7N901_9MYCO|nr:putative MFS-type transporter [Mycobacterium simulans]